MQDFSTMSLQFCFLLVLFLPSWLSSTLALPHESLSKSPENPTVNLTVLDIDGEESQSAESYEIRDRDEKDYGDIFIDDDDGSETMQHDSVDGSGMSPDQNSFMLNKTSPSVTFLDAEDNRGYSDDSLGSGVPPKSTYNMEDTKGLTKCQLLRHRALNGLQVFYTPVCKSNGEFQPLQCKDDECWCVSVDGRIIPYTRKRVRDRDRPPDCVQQKRLVSTNRETQTARRDETVRSTAGPPPSTAPPPPAERSYQIWLVVRPDILAGIVVGSAVGVICAALLVVFIIHRMKKKDEGSYVLDEPRRPSPCQQTYQRAPNKEFYA